MSPRIRFTLLSFLLLPFSAWTQCVPTRALVSGYFNNNVMVYDACAGTLIGPLDGNNRISGPQTISARPNGLIYVTSENNGRILRYNRNSLAYVDTLIDTGAGFRPISVAFDAAGDLYVAGFDADSVRLYDGVTGALKSTPVAARAGGLDGPEIGMRFGPDGLLYIPSYYTNTVLRFDPATGAISTFIAANAGGLRRPRGLVFEANGGLLVASEGSNQVLRFNSSGAAQGAFAAVTAPSGLKLTDDGRLLVTSGSSVRVFNAGSGASLGTLFQPENSGGLSGATNVETTSAVVDVAQIGSQYWLVGTGQVSGRVLELEMTSATGTLFGSAFDPSAVALKRWGRMRVEFTSCSSANFSWDSSGDNSARFGTGGYVVQSLIATRLTEDCLAQDFNTVTGFDYMNGTWVGGPSRNGEGLMISVTPSGFALMTLFTHRPVVY